MIHRSSKNSHVSSLSVVPDLLSLARTVAAARARVRTRAITVAVLAVSCISLIACGGGSKSSSTTPTTPTSVAISTTASSMSVATSGNVTLTATVTGSSNTAVTWACTGGTITAAGVYTAPSTAGSYTCTATSVADPTKTVPITVTVTAAPGTVGVTVTGASASVYAKLTDQFTATVTGSTNTAVTWLIQEGASGGTISAGGLYTAPSTAGTYHVIATSQADTTKSKSAAVTVTIPNPTFPAPPSITLSSVGATYSYPFTASDPSGTTVSYALTSAVTGASISGSTLTWNPTGTQLTNGPTTFSVKATTQLGGSTTQTWAVTPVRTVKLNILDNFWSPSYTGGFTQLSIGAIPAPVDAIAGSTTLPSVLSSDGTYYTINNVPSGNYWLEVGPTEKYYTNTSTFDVGTDYVGQQIGGNPAAMTLDISATPPATGLTLPSFAAGDTLWIGNADVNSWYAPTTQPTVSATSEVYTDVADIIPASTLPSLSYTAENSYVLQYDWGSPGGTYLGLSITASQPETTPPFDYTSLIDGALVAAATPTPLSLKMSGWSSLVQSGGTGTFFGTYLSAQPYTTPPLAAIGGGMPSCGGTLTCPTGYNGWSAIGAPEPATLTNAPHDNRQDGNPGPLYVAWAENCSGAGGPDGCAGASEGDSVTLSFSNPFPTTWPYVLWSQQEDSVTIAAYPTQAFVTYSNSAVEFSTIPATQTVVQPVVELVGSPEINGNWASSATLTAPLALTWTAPTTNGGARLAGYDVQVYAVPTSGAWGEPVAKLYTANTSLTVPTGILPKGIYVFVIEAVADATADVTGETSSGPFRSGYPKGTAQVVSQAMTISGS